MEGAVAIRRREEGDVADCAAIAVLLHRTDRYPRILPGGDLTDFVTPSNTLDGWVAVDGDTVVGQVLLRASSAPSSTQLAADVLGVDETALAFVARLMVVPEARRQGVARALLRTAAAGAVALDRRPVLDVLVEDAGAIALYEGEGWRRLGQTTFTVRDGQVFDAVVFAAP